MLLWHSSGPRSQPQRVNREGMIGPFIIIVELVSSFQVPLLAFQAKIGPRQ